MAYLLFTVRALSLDRGITEAKRSDLVFEELGALCIALTELKVEGPVSDATEAASSVSQEEEVQKPTGNVNVVLDGETSSDEDIESVPETISTERAMIDSSVA